MIEKGRKISLYSVELIKNNRVIDPEPIIALFKFIKTLPKEGRIQDLEDRKKIHLLEYFNDESPLYPAIIKSAKYYHRPPLIDKDNASERENPKSLTEGEGERTHLCIKKGDDELIIAIEDRKVGIGISSLISYLKHFTDRYYEHIGEPRRRLPYRINYAPIPNNDFLNELGRFVRADLGEIVIEKRILGSECLNLSDRTEVIRDHVTISVQPVPTFSVSDFMRELFNSVVPTRMDIKKIRVRGKTAEGVQLLIDSNLVKAVEDITVLLDEITGQVNSIRLLSALREIVQGQA
ncbi:MAG: hypothetical protein LDL11_08540 [Desulfarculus sp.]|nr:hypothetical protein [Desulfarculus sp.]